MHSKRLRGPLGHSSQSSQQSATVLRANGGARHTRRWFPLLAALLTAALLVVGYPQHSYAQVFDPGTSSFTPADLLSNGQLNPVTSLYYATTAQVTSLHTLEQQAVANTLADHGLPASDADAAQTWARPEAEAELWALLIQAVKTDPSARTPEQTDAVVWLSGIFKKQGVQAAQNAGLEYAKWAGLDQNAYHGLTSSNASESALSTFLSGQVSNFPGYCTYVSPGPYANEYAGRSDQTCFTPCTSFLGCNPPTPTYDQFVKWGEADVNNQLFNTADYAAAGRSIAIAASLGASLVAAVATYAAVSTALAGVMAGTALQVAVFPFATLSVATTETAIAAGAASAAESAAIGGGVAAGAVAAVAAVIVIAVVAAVLEGISVFDAASLPGKLAHLVAQARSNTVDLKSVLSDPGQAQGLYALFVGATVPTPQLTTCDNSVVPVSNYGTAAQPQCMNAPAIPAASAGDPWFKITPKDGTTPSYEKSMSFKDVSQNVSAWTRVSGAHWFVNTFTGSDNSTATSQSLHLHYTDWSGHGNNVWLVGDATQGFQFIGLPDEGGSGSAMNPATCLTDKTCFASSTINYVGSDGNDYTASLVANVNPVLTVSSSPHPVEGTAQLFSASATSPLNQTVTYSWKFEQQLDWMCPPAGSGIVSCTLPSGNQYGAPATGAQVSYTWPRSGTWHVQVTATDALGNSTQKTITVSVGAVAPVLTVNPPVGSAACTPSVTCDARTVDLGTAVSLAGVVGHAGSGDEETVQIDWGDGQTSLAKLGWNALYPATDLGISRTSDTSAAVSGTHTYASAGHYTAGITVTDATSTTVTGSANMTIQTTPILALPAPDAIVYGTKLSAVQLAATARAGQVQNVPGTFNYTVDGKAVALGTLLAAGAHTLSVSFTPTDTAVYKTPTPVSVPLQVLPAPLTVSADNQHMTLHGTLPTLSYSTIGYVNGEGASALSATPTCHTTAVSASPVGPYPITCGGGAAANYTITYKSGTLSVLYGWNGFSQPINDPTAGATVMSVFMAGSTVPVKFQLKDAKGTVVAAGALPVFSVTPLQACTTGTAITSTSTSAANTGTTYRWDSQAKQYIYNYKSPSSRGMCQYIQATLDDGTTQKVLVSYR